MRYFFGEFNQVLNLATRWLSLSCYSYCFSLLPPCSSLFLRELYFIIKKGHLRVFLLTPTLSPSLVQSASDSLTKQEGTIYSKLEKHLLSAWISQVILCNPFALGWRGGDGGKKFWGRKENAGGFLSCSRRGRESAAGSWGWRCPAEWESTLPGETDSSIWG